MARRSILLAWLLVAALAGPAAAAKSGASPLASLPSYEVTEHAPVIKGRQDAAYQRALAAAFRKAVVEALRDSGAAAGGASDFTSWQTGIFSRASEFIASYKVLSHSQEEGYLTLTIRARVLRENLENAVHESAALSPMIPMRLLVMVDNFPLAGGAGGDDIDAGHAAGSALESAFLKKGAVIVPSPERLPWQDIAGHASGENRLSLALDTARRLGAEYLVLGDLEWRADRLLVLSTELISLSSQKTIATRRSPVELQPQVPPLENFTAPAGEVALFFSRKLSGRAEGAPTEDAGRGLGP